MANEMPDTGGGETPLGAYNIISSQPAVELKGTTDVQDVQEVVTEALPSHVIFTLRFLPEVYDPKTVGTTAAQWAGYFNGLAALPGVAAVSTFQDINAADQLQDVMRIVVQSTSGKTRFAYEETQFGRRLDYLAPEIDAKVKELDAIEAGH